MIHLIESFAIKSGLSFPACPSNYLIVRYLKTFNPSVQEVNLASRED